MNVDFALELLSSRIQLQRITPAEARAGMLRDFGSDVTFMEVIELAYQRFMDESSADQILGGAVINAASYTQPWRPMELPNGHWSRYRSLLEESKHPGLDELIRSTKDITSLLAQPTPSAGKRKGLAMGNVQSGKTANFAGVIARAIDGGYKMVIVLAGLYNNLRAQTQARLDRDVFAEEDGWFKLSSVQDDVVYTINYASMVASPSPVAAVVKKNQARLASLIRMMERLDVQQRRNLPILIIDDEADQATPNSEADRAKISGINAQLRRLWSLVENGTYVAYTATPFANVLMDPDAEGDLFPSDFITTLNPGAGYFGPEQIFGLADATEDELASDGLDMVRQIPDEDVVPIPAGARATFDPEMSPSLRDAVVWFLTGTAIRLTREAARDSSMLVHTTHYATPHFKQAERIRVLIADLTSRARAGSLEEFKKSWEREATRVPRDGASPETWEQIATRLPDVLDKVKVVVDNGSSADRLDYTTEEAQVVIAVGGSTLARGLTLEGLMVSYFARSTSAYDALLQMGRWFGYRPGYEDLARIWVSKDLAKDYAFLALVEKDLRNEIRALQGSEFTPHQVGVRVRQHPGRLEITARNKMFMAQQVQVGLAVTERQTFILDGRPEVARQNWGAVTRLINGRTGEPSPRNPERRLYRDILTPQVVEFLGDFVHHPDQKSLASDESLRLITEWLTRFAPDTPWNVVLMGNSRRHNAAGDPLGTVTVDGHELLAFNRAPLVAGTMGDRIDIKALSSAGDKTSDLEPPAGTSPNAWACTRRQLGEGRGLLLIYPISAQSRPSRAGSTLNPTRQPMPDFVTEHLAGFSIVFPPASGATDQDGTFISVRRNWEIESVDEDELIEEDEDADESSD